MQDADGIGYTEYGQMLQVMAAHQAGLNITVYKQIWNEPDLTDYFNYSAGGVSFFHGTNSDYNQMYEAASTAMAVRTVICAVPLIQSQTVSDWHCCPCSWEAVQDMHH